MSLSRALLVITNIIFIGLSIVVLGAGVWLSNVSNGSQCISFLDLPLVLLGVFMLLVSLVGLIGAALRMALLLWIYAAALFFLTLILLGFTVFTFLVTDKHAAAVVSNQGYKAYRTIDFSNWLQAQVDSNSSWPGVRSCIVGSRVCSGLVPSAVKSTNLTDLYQMTLAPVKAGCCVPPPDCGFPFSNATSSWTLLSTPSSLNYTDCHRFSNNSTGLCYDCDTCKAGVLKSVTDKWRSIAYINIAVVIVVFCLYSLACCGFRSSLRRDNFARL